MKRGTFAELPLLRTVFLLFLSIQLISGCASIPKPEEMSDQQLTKLLMANSGVYQVFQGLPEAIKKSAGQNQDLDPSIRAKVQKAMLETFEPGKMSNRVEKILRKRLSRKEKIRLVNFYQSPLGRKIVYGENYLNTPQGAQAFNDYLMQMQNKEPDPKRLELIRQIIEYSGSLDIGADLVASVSIGMVNGLQAGLGEEEKVSSQELSQKIEEVKAALRQAMAPVVVLQTLFAYHDLSNKELAVYVRHLSQGTGKKFNRLVIRSMNYAFKKAARETGERIAKMIQNERAGG